MNNQVNRFIGKAWTLCSDHAGCILNFELPHNMRLIQCMTYTASNEAATDAKESLRPITWRSVNASVVQDRKRNRPEEVLPKKRNGFHRCWSSKKNMKIVILEYEEYQERRTERVWHEKSQHEKFDLKSLTHSVCHNLWLTNEEETECGMFQVEFFWTCRVSEDTA